MSLMVEEERFHNIERSMRSCQFCNMNMEEDEFHFLLVCPTYRNLRNTVLPSYYCRWPTITIFKLLLFNSSKITLQRLAKFVYLAFEHRKSLV